MIDLTMVSLSQIRSSRWLAKAAIQRCSPYLQNVVRLPLSVHQHPPMHAPDQPAPQ